MAVPISGPLSQLKMAREAKHADYNGSQSMGIISLYDLVNGGQANGSTVDYPTVNQNCLPNPANRSLSSFTATIYGPTTNCVNIFYAGSLSNLTNGSQLYSSNGGAKNLTAGNYYVCDNITVFGCTAYCAAFVINSSNVVTSNSNGVCCP